MPEALQGRIKRPDYLVGIPGVGLVAFDVKSKTIHQEGIIFDLAEIRKLRTFARFFHLTVFLACLRNDGQQAYWVRLDQLDDVPAVRPNGTLTLCLPAEHALPISHARPFYDALVAALTM